MKYFYTSLIEAAYMELTFNVKLYRMTRNTPSSEKPLSIRFKESANGFRYDYEGCTEKSLFVIDPSFYIHSDSLHLLKLHDGDIIMRDNGKYYGWATFKGDFPYPVPIKLEEGEKIIQRNGKPFIWPKEKKDGK